MSVMWMVLCSVLFIVGLFAIAKGSKPVFSVVGWILVVAAVVMALSHIPYLRNFAQSRLYHRK